MVATDIREQRLRIQPRRAAGGVSPGPSTSRGPRNCCAMATSVSLGPKAELAADVARGAAANAGATLELAHRAGVRAPCGERAIPTGDARRPELGRPCFGTTGPRRLQRLPRRVTDSLPASRGAPRGAAELLDAPAMRDAVTRAASDFGFWHLGRFAGQYRALFGEAPSTTLARARAGLDKPRT